MRTLLAALALLLPVLAAADGLLVIAHPEVPVNSISTEQLASLYLLQKTNWSDGVHVVPVNRELASNVRDHFSESVLHHTPQELATYWNRLRFHGRLPPVVQTSDQAVVGFVRNVPGAIGYIGAGQVPAGVKVLARLP